MKLRHILIISVLFLTATIAISIPLYHPNLEPIKEGRANGIPNLTWNQITNKTEAIRLGIRGYILAKVIKPTGLLVIPVNGTLKATVELSFVSYDSERVTETNISVTPQLSFGGGEFYSFTASSEPNGNMTLYVNEPRVIYVTFSVPKGQRYGVGLGGNYGATFLEIKSDYPVQLRYGLEASGEAAISPGVFASDVGTKPDPAADTSNVAGSNTISISLTNQNRTLAVQRNATATDTPVIAVPAHNDNPGPVNTSLSIYGSVALVTIAILALGVYLVRARFSGDSSKRGKERVHPLRVKYATRSASVGLRRPWHHAKT